MEFDEKRRRRPPPPPPPLPSSFKPHSWEMIDLQDDAKADPRLQPHIHTNPGVTPYLGLRARLSQVWFNRWTVLLLLVLVRVILLTGSLNDNIASAKIKALSACTKVEDVGSAMASMPHYLSVGVNSLAADGISKTVRGLVEVLTLILNGVQNLILFVVNLYVGTIVCLISALIHGTFDVANGAIKGVEEKMNSAVGAITNGLASEISTFENALKSASDAIKGIPIPFGKSIPTLDVSGRINDLKNVKIDTSSITRGLSEINKTIPDFSQMEKLANDALSIPFGLLTKLIDDKFGNYTFEDSVFPIAEKKALSFCSNNSFLNDFFNNLAGIVAKAKIAFAVTIPILAILAMVMMGYVEIRRWRREKMRSKVFTEQGFDPMDVVYIASRPVTAGAGIKLAARFSGKKNIMIRWAIAYATSLPALFVLSLAIAGFFSCFCQWIVLRSIEKEAPALTNQVGNFAGDVVKTLAQVSTDWSNGANGVILNLQSDINNDMFGWVRNATSAVNSTLNTIDTEINKKVNDIFANTVLINTAREIVNCLVGRKIDAVQKGLTFVHDHAKVTLPLFADNLFVQGANDSLGSDSKMTTFLASPSSVTTDEVSGAVEDVVTMLHNGIIQEALISLALLLVYVVVVLIGVIRSAIESFGPDKTRGEGGARYAFERNQSTPAVPAYEEVVYAGTVPRGKTGVGQYHSHNRKSSYPEVEGVDR